MVYLFVFLLLLILTWRVFNRHNVLVNGLFITYIISTLAAIVYVYIDSDGVVVNNTTKYEPLFYLLLVLIIFFSGFNSFSFNIKKTNIRKKSILLFSNWVGWFFMPIVILLVYNDINVLRNVNLAEYRVIADYYSTGLFKGGLVLSLFIYISELFFVPQFLFFYVLQFKDVSKWLKIRLLLASFSFAFMTLLFAGRDGIVYWVMNALIFYFLFKNNYSNEIKKVIKKGGIIVFALLMIPFFAISIARFFIVGTGSIADSVKPLVEYMGQGPHIFCQSFYVNADELRGYDKTALSTNAINSLQLYLGWTFGTFIKSLVWGFGKIGAIFVAIVFGFFARLFSKMHNTKHDIWSLFIIVMLFQVPFWGVFYYRQALNMMYVVHLIFAFICLIMYASKKKC